ncbi:hypothetical protein GGQ86_001102 [Xanthobacter flavus]|uniref:Uncharacterized protein n=1 Tax=Xanthobacter flavus TaxID=281 RepID=A0A9W6FKH2_XANFL|nr:hypothetical protein [Xanthobacter flavus]MDR6332638.1 hypothetical protein [Xanthobacter flavus]GLI20913.1 hypothetical protein XFLAVUS301_05870 [Xanthobacter flavus]
MSGDDPTAVAAVPALPIAGGFRLLVMRELVLDDGPPAYAVIGQTLVRAPPRSIRHGVAFALAFGPDMMAWLNQALGRPAWRDASGETQRNPRWPALGWHRAPRTWPGGTLTTEWSADILFPEEADRAGFALAFAEALAGREPVSETA